MEMFRFIVRGRVQGVGFRAYVQREAERLGASGEVWNRRDGAVELLSSLDLEAILKDGPGLVTTVEKIDHPHPLVGSFEIGPTR